VRPQAGRVGATVNARDARAATTFGLVVGALTLALYAQAVIDRVPFAAWGNPDPGAAIRRGGMWFVVAAVCWAVALWRLPDAGDVQTPPDAPSEAAPALSGRRLRLFLIGIAAVLATTVVLPLLVAPGSGGLAILRYKEDVSGWPWRSNNVLTWPGLVLWVVGTACVVAALRAEAGRARGAPPTGRAAWIAAHRPVRWPVRQLFAGGVVLAVAAVFRLWDLDRLPLDMSSDHTEKLLDIWDVIGGARPVFLDQNAGREPLQFYLTAFLVKLGLPFGFWTQKFGMQLVSIATVPLLFVAGKRIAGARVGWLAAAVLALAPWHIQISRAAMRIAWSPFFSTLTLACLILALSTGRRNAWLALGIALGAGMYGYTGFRPMAIVVGMAVGVHVAHALWRGPRAVADGLRAAAPLLANAAAAALVSLLVAAPLIRYAVDRPEFWARTLTRMAGDEAAALPPLAGLLAPVPVVGRTVALLMDPRFWRNTGQAMGMANFTADSAWIHSPPGRPGLETIGGALLVLGAVTALVWAVRRRHWRAGLVLAAVPPMLLASILALAYPIEVPHLARAAGALPFVAVLCALPLAVLLASADRAFGWAGRAAAWALVAVLFVGMDRNTAKRYFVEYRENYDRSSQNTSDGVAAVRTFLADGGALDRVFLVGWSNGWDYRVIGLSFGQPDWNGLLWGVAPDGSDAVNQADDHAADPERQLYLVAGPRAEANIAYLRELFPGAVVAPGAARSPDKPFWTVVVPADPARGGLVPNAVPAEPSP